MPAPGLFSLEGELVSLRIGVDPKHLEDLLEALALLNFPVNPQLYHRPGQVTVEFPAYSARLGEVSSAIRSLNFKAGCLEVSKILA